MEFTGQTLQVIGEVMIGLTAIMVHRRFWKEHKIDTAVYREMKREQTIGIIGIIMLIVGYLLQVIS
jgi:hypothetical protein